MKSDYELMREDHKYRLPDGELADASITTIAGMLDLGKSDAMANAAARLARGGESHAELWKRKTDDGTDVHAYFEDWLAGRPVHAPKRLWGFLDSLELAFAACNLTSLCTVEFAVFGHISKMAYGGRGDYMDPARIIDLKSGPPRPLAHLLQLAALKFAEGIIEYGPDGAVTGSRPMPKDLSTYGLYVQGDGSFDKDRDFIDYDAGVLDYAAFCQLLFVYVWQRDRFKKRRKA